MQLSRDIWSEIVKHVNLADFRNTSLTCTLINKLIKPRRLKYLRILWRWRNKTRNMSNANINKYCNKAVGRTLTFKGLANGSCFAFFVDNHLTKLPDFVKKTLKTMEARYNVKCKRAQYYLYKIEKRYPSTSTMAKSDRQQIDWPTNAIHDIPIDQLEYITDMKLVSLNICRNFDHIDYGSTYSECMVSLLLIIHTLDLKDIIWPICNDRTTQYAIWNPAFEPDLTPYENVYQQIKDQQDVKFRLRIML